LIKEQAEMGNVHMGFEQQDTETAVRAVILFPFRLVFRILSLIIAFLLALLVPIAYLLHFLYRGATFDFWTNPAEPPVLSRHTRFFLKLIKTKSKETKVEHIYTLPQPHVPPSQNLQTHTVIGLEFPIEDEILVLGPWKRFSRAAIIKSVNYLSPHSDRPLSWNYYFNTRRDMIAGIRYYFGPYLPTPKVDWSCECLGSKNTRINSSDEMLGIFCLQLYQLLCFAKPTKMS